MTVGDVQVSAWVAWLLAVFACVGLWAVLWQCDRAGRWLWQRLHDRGDDGEVCARCACSVWPEEISAWSEGTQAVWREKRLCLPCQNETGLPWLPELPERTWEQMTSHQLPLDGAVVDEGIPGAPTWGHYLLAEHRERRAPWWEAEHRAAYQDCGLDYPSGLLARVREAGQ